MGTLAIQDLAKQYALSEGYAVQEINLNVNPGEILALVGESGSGKTTLLRLISGLEQPDAGGIYLNEKLIASASYALPPEKRHIGMVFQDYALFPHLTVYENIVYGLNKHSRKARQERAREVLRLVNLQGYEQKYPYELSGGQQQRTALARALAPSPSIVLLDEPFSNLDDIMKDQVREDIRTILKQTKTTAVFVTHDTEDALSTADRIAVLRQGKVNQIDKPEAIYAYPNSVYVANFFGKVNVIPAKAVQSGFCTEAGFIAMRHHQNVGDEVKLLIRPEDINLCQTANEEYRAQVLNVSYYGSHIQVLACVKTLELLIRSENNVSVTLGQPVPIKLDTDKIRILENH